MQQAPPAESAVAWQSLAAHGWTYKRNDGERWSSILNAITALSADSKQQIVGRDLTHSLFNVYRLDRNKQPDVAAAALTDGRRLQQYLFGNNVPHPDDWNDDPPQPPPRDLRPPPPHEPQSSSQHADDRNESPPRPPSPPQRPSDDAPHPDDWNNPPPYNGDDDWGSDPSQPQQPHPDSWNEHPPSPPWPSAANDDPRPELRVRLSAIQQRIYQELLETEGPARAQQYLQHVHAMNRERPADDNLRPPPPVVLGQDGHENKYDSDEDDDAAIQELESILPSMPVEHRDDVYQPHQPEPLHPRIARDLHRQRKGVKVRPQQATRRKDTNRASAARSDAVLRARVQRAQAALVNSLSARYQRRGKRRREDDHKGADAEGGKRQRMLNEEDAFLHDISSVLSIIGSDVAEHRPTLQLMASDLTALLSAEPLSNEARVEVNAALEHIDRLLRPAIAPPEVPLEAQDCPVDDDSVQIEASSDAHPSTRYHVGQVVPRDQIALQRGDGNCLFRCLAYTLYGDAERYGDVRAAVCDWMERNTGELARWFGDDLQIHIDAMRRDRTWGTELELYSAGRLWLMNIEVFPSVYDARSRTYTLTGFIRASPWVDNPSFNVWLSHPNGNHYDLLYFEHFGRRHSRRRLEDAEDEQPMKRARRSRRENPHFTVQSSAEGHPRGAESDPENLERLLAQRRAGAAGERVPVFTVPVEAKDEDVPDAVSVHYPPPQPLADVRPIRIRRRDDEIGADDVDDERQTKKARTGERATRKRGRDIELRRQGGASRRQRADEDQDVESPVEQPPHDARGASRKRARDVELRRQGGPARRRRLNPSGAEDQPLTIAPRRRRAARAPVRTTGRRHSARIVERAAAAARANPRRSTRARRQATRREPKMYGVGGAIRP